MRGTPAAYEAAKTGNRIEQDTLYFLYEQDASEAILYLGTKLISGGSSSLSELTDILISENIADKSVLIYDSEQEKWIDTELLDILPVMVGSTESSTGVAGLVPAPPAGADNLFLSSSGQWVAIDGGSSSLDQNILTYENTQKLTHEEIIFEVGTDTNFLKDDILIIKDVISIDEDKWQYTAYIYNGISWIAMDGNYNAENVYFDKDLVTTVSIGNITLEDNGRATIAAAGKNLKQVFDTIFVKEQNPIITDPSVSFDSVTSGKYEVGSYVTPSYFASFDPGNYEFGPDTEIIVNSWSVSNTQNETLDTASGEFTEIQITDDTSYTITATANHTAGTTPITNVGNDYEDGIIQAGVKSKTSNKIEGYRKTFYGTLEEKNELTSDDIRDLAKSSTSAFVNGSKLTLTIPLNAMRVVIAYPATLRDVSSILDVNAMNAEIKSSFKKSTIEVEGANDYSGISYKVYVLDYAEPNDTENTYTIQI